MPTFYKPDLFLTLDKLYTDDIVGFQIIKTFKYILSTPNMYWFSLKLHKTPQCQSVQYLQKKA